MIKWNQVTWYSRFWAIIIFLGALPVLAFYIGTQYELTIISDLETQNLTMPVTQASAPSSSNHAAHLGSHDSPNGQYTAMTYSDENGVIDTYIINSQGKKLTGSYCGSFGVWSPDSTKVKVYIPSECGYTNAEQYYYLTVDNTRQTLEGQPFIPATN